MLFPPKWKFSNKYPVIKFKKRYLRRQQMWIKQTDGKNFKPVVPSSNFQMEQYKRAYWPSFFIGEEAWAEKQLLDITDSNKKGYKK